MKDFDLYIAPPFGNWLGWLPFVNVIRGSFTLEERPGLWERIRNNFWYDSKKGGYVNCIGLRNCGIVKALSAKQNTWFPFTYKKNDLLSIAILDMADVGDLNKLIPTDCNLEINISCPNTEKKLNTVGIETFLNKERLMCTIKLPPVVSFSNINKYYQMGFRMFDTSNTLPLKDNDGNYMGGLSGPSLKMHTIRNISYIRNKYGDDVYIIAGGGVRSMEDAKCYLDHGANAISVSTLCCNPLLFTVFYVQYLKNKASHKIMFFN